MAGSPHRTEESRAGRPLVLACASQRGRRGRSSSLASAAQWAETFFPHANVIATLSLQHSLHVVGDPAQLYTHGATHCNSIHSQQALAMTREQTARTRVRLRAITHHHCLTINYNDALGRD